MRAKKSAQTLQLSRPKAYLKTLKQEIERLLSSPTTALANTDEEFRSQLEASLDFIRNNGRAFVPFEFANGQKVRADDYNEMISAIYLDLATLYSQIENLEYNTENLSSQYTILMENALTRINQMLSQVRNMEKLGLLWDEVDDIHYDTFVQDTNAYPDQFLAAVNDNEAGLMRLNTVNIDDIVINTTNYDLLVKPLNKNLNIRTDGFDLTGQEPQLHYDIVASSTKPSLINTEIGSETITFDGGAVGLILQLPDDKIINNIAFGHISPNDISVLGLFYSESRETTLESAGWNKITDATTDKFNLQFYDYSFSPVTARSLLIIVGQPSARQKKVSMRNALQLREDTKLTDIFSLIGQVTNRNKQDTIQSYLPKTISRIMTNATKNIIDKLLGFIENLIQPILPEQGTNTDNFISIYEYIFDIYGLEVHYRRYNNASVYLSQPFNEKGDILSTQLVTTESLPEDKSAIKYYIEIGGRKLRLVPREITTIYDTYTIETAGESVILTDLLIDTSESVEVKVNNISCTFTTNDLYTTKTLATGITLTGCTTSPGDFVTIQYTPANIDTVLRSDQPDIIDIQKHIGRPNLRFNNLTNNSQQYLTLTDEGKEDFKELSNLQDIVPIYIENPSGSVEPVELAYGVFSLHGLGISGAIPNLSVRGSNGFGIPTNYVLRPPKTIYKGIINEQISLDGSSSYGTDYSYLKGTLHGQYNGYPILLDEYDVTAPGDRDTFDIVDWTDPTSGSLSVSYIPLDTIMSGQTTNLADPNTNETFTNTNVDNAVILKYLPWVDLEILQEATKDDGTWEQQEGSEFVYKWDSVLRYEPIVVYVGTRKAINRTNYTGQSAVEMNEYNPETQNFEFVQIGNKLVFNTAITEDIYVKYYAQSLMFRLRAELLRIDKTDDGLTPELYDLALLINRG